MNSEHASEWIETGMALHEEGRYSEALAAYEHAAYLEPGNALVAFYQGGALLGEEQFTEALAAFDRAIALGEDVAPFYREQGVAFYWLGRLEEALAAVEKAQALATATYPASLEESKLTLSDGSGIYACLVLV